MKRVIGSFNLMGMEEVRSTQAELATRLRTGDDCRLRIVKLIGVGDDN